jgi:hypothetical protein
MALRDDVLNRIRARVQAGEVTPADPLIQQDVHDRVSDRALREKYAWWFVLILVFQLVAMNAIFMAYGYRVLSFDEVSLRIFMGGTLAEVFGVILVITRYLFSRKLPR